MARRTLLTGNDRRHGRACPAPTMAFAAPGARAPRRLTANRVAVLGGGVRPGLTAAHELAERGFFAVTVYERKALGGKARSNPGARGRPRAGGWTCLVSTGFRLLSRVLPEYPGHDEPNPVQRQRPAASGTTW